jgi:hypothetical protein
MFVSSSLPMNEMIMATRALPRSIEQQVAALTAIGFGPVPLDDINNIIDVLKPNNRLGMQKYHQLLYWCHIVFTSIFVLFPLQRCGKIVLKGVGQHCLP